MSGWRGVSMRGISAGRRVAEGGPARTRAFDLRGAGQFVAQHPDLPARLLESLAPLAFEHGIFQI